MGQRGDFCNQIFARLTPAIACRDTVSIVRSVSGRMNEVINICVQFSTNCNLVLILPQSSMHEAIKVQPIIASENSSPLKRIYAAANNNNSNDQYIYV